MPSFTSFLLAESTADIIACWRCRQVSLHVTRDRNFASLAKPQEYLMLVNGVKLCLNLRLWTNS
jgi:hypothetical protein